MAIAMFFGGAICGSCGVPTDATYRAFYLRLLPGFKYAVICDRCLACERRALLTEGLYPDHEQITAQAGDAHVPLYNTRAAMAHMVRRIERLSSSGSDHWPIVHLFHHARKRSS
jgi:hypothetical protein